MPRAQRLLTRRALESPTVVPQALLLWSHAVLSLHGHAPTMTSSGDEPTRPHPDLDLKWQRACTAAPRPQPLVAVSLHGRSPTFSGSAPTRQQAEAAMA